MAESKISHQEIYNGYIAATTNKAVVLFTYVAQKYELKDARYTKTQDHLCLYCDLFFQHSREVSDFRESSGGEAIERRSIDHRKYFYPHWPKIYLLIAAATKGCHICQLFLSQLTVEEQEQILKFEQMNSQHGSIHLFFPSSRGGPGHIRMQFKAPPKLSNSGSCIVVDLTIDQTETDICNFDKVTENELDRPLATWEVAYSWIVNCIVNHSGCRNHLLLSQKRPRRLIDAGDHDDAVRLCRSSKLDSDVLYVTLSHCWGPSGVPFKLQTANESKLFEQIPMSEISKTFKDAIAFTRRLRLLGIRYIWIDALCILQDSQEDWDNQALIMGEIYGGSICTLAACTGSDGNSGLYPNLDGISRRMCTIKGSASGSVRGPFTVRNKDIMGNKVRNNTILSRAWCVQELALSPRVLYFGRDHAAWDCSTLLAEDTAPTHHMTREDGYGFGGRKFRYWNRALGDWAATHTDVDAKTRTFNYYHAWMNILREYSGCALTRHTDRLIAISGIARIIHAGIGQNEEYVAGLWKTYLAFNLVWEVRNGRKDYQLWPYRAPSWSWASVEGGIYNHLTNAEAISNCVSLIQASAEVDLKSADPFGSVRGEILHVQGPVFKAFLGPRGHTTAQHLCKLFISVEDDGTQSGKEECITPYPVNLDIKYPGPEPVTVYCLLVMTTSLPDHLGGLILVPQRDFSIPGRYIRIGVSTDLPKNLLKLARSLWRLREEECESFIEGGDYRISII